jgi:hypothetical protein
MLLYVRLMRMSYHSYLVRTRVPLKMTFSVSNFQILVFTQKTPALNSDYMIGEWEVLYIVRGLKVASRPNSTHYLGCKAQ